MSENNSYLGFDFSTQQLKAIVINDKLEVTHQSAVTYDTHLPEFRTHGGYLWNDLLTEATTPTLMWVKALDILLDRLKLEGVDFSTVKSLSGAAQHGSVYWKTGAEEILKKIQPNKFLHEELQECFVKRRSPIWLDDSSYWECKQFEEAIGGPVALAQLTGSRAFERFTGNQILKYYQNKPGYYMYTERISLISSFGATLFLGKYAPIDLSDASGMNILDIRTKSWSDLCLKAIAAPGLKEKLGDPVPVCTVLGPVSSYFIERYGFSENCKVVAFTGDNPASLAGTQMNENDMIISLGTSDTVILWLKQPKISVTGHTFINPIDNNEFMGMLCFKNGSLTRERIRDECAEGSWELFNALLESTPPGNFGNIGMFFDQKEITPPAMGNFRFNKNNELIQRFSKEVDVRAVVEGQFVAKRLYAEEFGFKADPTSRIIATGGASTNKSLIQVLSDVFNLPVFTSEIANSACLGSALRAKHALLGEGVPFKDMFSKPLGLNLSATPAKDAAEIYDPMVARYKILQDRAVAETPPK
ncbi:hypothetical protein CDAR_538162 [Caerostris darwini]|uniref:Xylulose kinase n=1 Tax=Caerostris darwini TaxID=1538125 RepID=A0AAV4UCJ5_9ARAC|nr:hypothetical protein CDAR_538162 [Caerostris darwini]